MLSAEQYSLGPTGFLFSLGTEWVSLTGDKPGAKRIYAG